ncbi:hypothetical protein MATL_G00233430 [Megalops atlanticus]|uniref:Uncharacterized protein n=1 Tax=Megalops atlanticus TaxID=7932 RepID=A0A9D3PHE2_MEGAT|nr:hypothetical protein MATL_G00233430 [Megalops atlanticus]
MQRLISWIMHHYDPEGPSEGRKSCPLKDDGQGLLDICCQVVAWWLQAAQRLLHLHILIWRQTTCKKA